MQKELFTTEGDALRISMLSVMIIYLKKRITREALEECLFSNLNSESELHIKIKALFKSYLDSDDHDSLQRVNIMHTSVVRHISLQLQERVYACEKIDFIRYALYSLLLDEKQEYTTLGKVARDITFIKPEIFDGLLFAESTYECDIRMIDYLYSLYNMLVKLVLADNNEVGQKAFKKLSKTTEKFYKKHKHEFSHFLI